jgi:lipoic acid synthetase
MLPRWLKKKIPLGNSDFFTERTIGDLSLATVCDHAKCPNRAECYSRNTATFMILGETCTRSCGFCNIATGKPKPVDADEPERIAVAVQRLGLRYVVLTSVSRDDLPDGGAEHFCNCIESLRSIEKPPAIEVLPSDFAGNMDAVDKLADALPNVYNYNVETVPRLFRQVRGAIPTIERTLAIFERVKKRHPEIMLKSGMMLGLGETDEEVKETLKMLYNAGCDVITIGQYLQPNKQKLPVVRYVTPEQFNAIAETAKQIGFKNVAAAPFVRSSYRAEMMCDNLNCK